MPQLQPKVLSLLSFLTLFILNTSVCLGGRDFVTEITDPVQGSQFLTMGRVSSARMQAVSARSSGIIARYRSKGFKLTPDKFGAVTLPSSEFGAYVYTRSSTFRLTSPVDIGRLIIISDIMDRYEFAEKARLHKIPGQPEDYLGAYVASSQARTLARARQLLQINLTKYEKKIQTLKTQRKSLKGETIIDTAISALGFIPKAGWATSRGARALKEGAKRDIGRSEQSSLRDQLYARLKDGDVSEESLFNIYMRAQNNPELIGVVDPSLFEVSGVSLKHSNEKLLNQMLKHLDKVEFALKSANGDTVLVRMQREKLKRYLGQLDADGNLKINPADESKDLAKLLNHLEQELKNKERQLQEAIKRDSEEEGKKPTKADIERMQVQAELRSWAIQESMGAIAGLVSLVDPKLGHKLGVIGGAASRMHDVVSKLNVLILKEGFTASVVLGGLFGMTNAALGLYQGLFMKDPAAERFRMQMEALEQISKGIVAVSKQIEALHKGLIELGNYLEKRFNNTDALILQVYEDLSERLNELRQITEDNQYKLGDIQQSIHNTIEKADRVFVDIKALFRESREESLVKNIIQCNEHSLGFTTELPKDEIRTCFNAYYHCAVGGAAATWFAGKSEVPDSHKALVEEVNSLKLNSGSEIFGNIRYLGKVADQIYRFPALVQGDALKLPGSSRPILRPGNPNVYRFCAERYIELAEKTKDGFYKKSVTPYALNRILEEGHRLLDVQSDVAGWNLNHRLSKKQPTGHEFLKERLGEYKKALLALQKEIQNRIVEKRRNSLNGWNPWVDPNHPSQSKLPHSKKRDLPASFQSIAACEGFEVPRTRRSGNQIVIPAEKGAIEKLIPKSFLLAYDLGLGSFEVCYDEVNYWGAKAWKSLDDRLNRKQSGRRSQLLPYVMIRARFLLAQQPGKPRESLPVFRRFIDMGPHGPQFQIDGAYRTHKNDFLATWRCGQDGKRVIVNREKAPDEFKSYKSPRFVSTNPDLIRRYKERIAQGGFIGSEDFYRLKIEAFLDQYKNFVEATTPNRAYLEESLHRLAQAKLKADALKKYPSFAFKPYRKFGYGDFYTNPFVTTKSIHTHKTEIETFYNKAEERIRSSVTLTLKARMTRIGRETAADLQGRDKHLRALGDQLDASRRLLVAYLRIAFPQSFLTNSDVRALFYETYRIPGAFETRNILRTLFDMEQTVSLASKIKLGEDKFILCRKNQKRRPEDSERQKEIIAAKTVFSALKTSSFQSRKIDIEKVFNAISNYQMAKLSECIDDGLLIDYPEGQNNPEVEDLVRRIKLFKKFYKTGS